MRDAELRFLLYLQNHVRTTGRNRFWLCVTRLGNGSFLWIVLSAVMLLLPQTRWIAVRSFVLIAFGELVINAVVKMLIRRKRPYDVCEELSTVQIRPKDTSFPSGHTCMGFVMTLFYAQVMPGWFAVSILVISCMLAFSRMYLGVHYPTDILGGIMLAVGIDWVYFLVWSAVFE